MVHQRSAQGLRECGLHEARRNAIAAQLSQVIHAHRVAVGIDESGEEDLTLAVDVLGAFGVGADDGAVDDDRARGQDALAIEDADVVERDFGVGRSSFFASCVVRCDYLGWIEGRNTGIVVEAGSSGL